MRLTRITSTKAKSKSESMTIDNSVLGKRIVFLYGVSDDRLNKHLGTGDQGTIRDVTSLGKGKTMISVDWFNDCNLPLMNNVDQFEIIGLD